MDFEAPVDAWYVWMAVAIVSVTLAGVALAVPTGPPPDANEAANTVDTVAGSAFQGSGSYAHDADEVKITPTSIALRNDHGTDRATFAYETVVPVHGQYRPWGPEEVSQRQLLHIISGESPADTYWWSENPTMNFITHIDHTYQAHDESWSDSEMELTVRKIRFPPTLIDMLADDPPLHFDCPVINRHCIDTELEWLHYDSNQEEFYVILVTA